MRYRRARVEMQQPAAEIERRLLQGAGALLVDPRLLRRIIKVHRGASGLVPHARCYAIAHDDLVATGLAGEIGVPLATLPDPIVAVARPSPRELASSTESQIHTRLWRAVFHARVHVAYDELIREGLLDAAGLRARIDRIGQTEFDEIRAILRHDDLVLPPYDDREVYVEFAALYLELRHFAPGLLVTTFPGLAELDAIDAQLAADIDILPLIESGRPDQVEPPPSSSAPTSSPTFSAPAAFGIADAVTLKPVSLRAHERLMARGAAARRKGNDVRAALLTARAATVESPSHRATAETATREALTSLGARLQKALQAPESSAPDAVAPSWGALLVILGDRAGAERASRLSIEARLLYALQLAALAHEKPLGTVDVADWMLSFGKQKIVRSLPATREVRIARQLRAAAKMVRHTRVAAADRKLLSRLLDWANARAELNVRLALRPKIQGALDRVGLTAHSEPERLARDKLVEELLDDVLANGFLSFGSLRDALSRNQLKLPDLAGVGELWSGDPLLLMDRALAEELDGIYRRGDAYVRWLQKLSSLPFGTRVGRALTLFALLPLGGAFILLEAVRHLVVPRLAKLGVHFEPMNVTALALVALVIFGLLHSAGFRAAVRQLVELTSFLLAFVFIRVPRAILARPIVRRWLALPTVRLFLRRVIVPGLFAGGAWLAYPALFSGGVWPRAAATAGVLVGSSLLFATRVGAWLEDLFFEQLAPTWHVVSRQLIPGLLRVVGRFFAALMDLLERAIYRVDEALRFREGQNPAMLFLKGGIGLVWAMVAYVLRLYVNLLVEPYVNPLKHFPAVAAAHKLMLPLTPTIFSALSTAFAPLGAIVGGSLATVTAFLLPTAWGFLAWELKENYRLYRATRPDQLSAAPVGPRGETMRGLLVVGFHSGTLPKLYERLRRAAQREDEAAVARRVKGKPGKPGAGLPSLGRFREGLHEVEMSVRRFVDRELVALLHGTSRWRHGPIEVGEVELSSNRVRVKLHCRGLGPTPCEITFEEQSGYIVAGMAVAGFVGELQRSAGEGALLFENALAGLYQRAEVDIVRQQLEAEIGEAVHYDISGHSLLVWPSGDFRTELSYRISGRIADAVMPKVSGDPPSLPARALDVRNVLFSGQRIEWLSWVSAWSAAAHPTAPIPRLARGTTLLASPERASATTLAG